MGQAIMLLFRIVDGPIDKAAIAITIAVSNWIAVISMFVIEYVAMGTSTFATCDDSI